jgi:diketogulonate reductase-like aldo/keto reductase
LPKKASDNTGSSRFLKTAKETASPCIQCPKPLFEKFSKIGLGTWMMERDPKGAVRALHAGFDAGANHVDTAEMYGSGEVEEIVGAAIAGRRHKVFLVSKVLPENASYKGTLAACERSLKRLKTDHLDVYLLHWRERNTQIAETFRAFEELKAAGKILSWGVSNFDVDDMEETERLMGPGQVACNQVLYHLKERAVESKLLPWCREHKVPVVAYSPFGQGKPPSGKVLSDLARKYEATPAQIALAFLIGDSQVWAIPKSADEKRVRENAGAMKINLSDEDRAQINEVFPVKPRRGLPML